MRDNGEVVEILGDVLELVGPAGHQQVLCVRAGGDESGGNQRRQNRNEIKNNSKIGVAYCPRYNTDINRITLTGKLIYRSQNQ